MTTNITESIIPIGWRFYYADFSLVASGTGRSGRVMLQRSPEDLARWHCLSDSAKDHIGIYAVGNGAHFNEALAAAIKEAFLMLPVTEEEK